MALLALKDIGKIYVSEGNVTVGIRGVSLSFDRGEFVAVTGKSGSGKSTLLNVISGMDSYEEGEMIVEGQATSHYLQPDWEDYRQKYISFIFQDYNIIESFTVLQNVELALMHIDDKRERRRRALDLLHRVGLSNHVHQKGSKLSGGQKQRTVIARALAKDSPIILADEPTGNLDAATSEEIITLLREVSHDKLLIMVTHNFEQVAHVATRHVRIFDGAVESDHVITPVKAAEENQDPPGRCEKTARFGKKDLKNGVLLGSSIFKAKPRLSVFLCLLLIVGMLGIFAVTTLCGDAMTIFEPRYMFEHIDGRMVVVRRDGAPLSDTELRELADRLGAESVLHYDVLLDDGRYRSAAIGEGKEQRYVRFLCTYGQDYGEDILGRYPEKSDEVLLYLPIYLQPQVGKDTLLLEKVSLLNAVFKVTGVKYYYDNNQTARCLFTEEGFHTATAVYYLQSGNTALTLSVSADKTADNQSMQFHNFVVSHELKGDTVMICNGNYAAFLKAHGAENCRTTLDFAATYTKYDYYYGYGGSYDYYYDYDYDYSGTKLTFTHTFTGDAVLAGKASDIDAGLLYNEYNTDVIISAEALTAIAQEALAGSYRQASLFFANDRAAERAAESLQGSDYIAVPSNTEYTPDSDEAISTLLLSLGMGLVWILAVVFLAFFVNLCSFRSLDAFKGDMAIMRSMGIPVRVIRVGMYARMMLSLIPACVLLALSAVLIFTTPKFNEYFTYLYAWQYAAILLGMLLLTLRTTKKQIGRLFGESVKKSLRGGDAA